MLKIRPLAAEGVVPNAGLLATIYLAHRLRKIRRNDRGQRIDEGEGGLHLEEDLTEEIDEGRLDFEERKRKKL